MTLTCSHLVCPTMHQYPLTGRPKAQMSLVFPLVNQKALTLYTPFILNLGCKWELIRESRNSWCPGCILIQLNQTLQKKTRHQDLLWFPIWFPQGSEHRQRTSFPHLARIHQYGHLVMERLLGLLMWYLQGVSSVSEPPVYPTNFDELFDLSPRHWPSYHTESQYYGFSQPRSRWMDRWMNGQMNGWTGGWMHEWIDGWTDRWMANPVKVFIIIPELAC